MSDFLFIIPEGWVQLDWQYITGNTILSYGQTLDFLATNQMIAIEEALKAIDAIPPESSVIEARLFNDEVFIVKLG